MTAPPTFATLEVALITAEQRFNEASEAARTADREVTAALNDLNAAQKAVETRLAEMRKLSASSSDWGRPAGQRVGS